MANSTRSRTCPPSTKKYKHDIDVVVDRLVIKAGLESRLADSLETALRLADGIAVAEFADRQDEKGKPERLVFSEKFACPGLRFHHRGNRATALFLQQSRRRLPEL